MKAILFDIDDTLLDFKACSHQSIYEASKILHVDLPTSIYDSFDSINEGLWKQVEKEEMTTTELFKIRFNTIFKATGVVADGIAFEAEFRKALDNSHERIPHAKEVLIELKKRYKIYAASNARLSQQINRLALAGLLEYFDDVFVSEEIGYTKPKKEFFFEIFKRTELEKTDFVLIGDSLSSDIQGANQAGIVSIWFNPNHINNSEFPNLLEIDDLRLLLKML